VSTLEAFCHIEQGTPAVLLSCQPCTQSCGFALRPPGDRSHALELCFQDPQTALIASNERSAFRQGPIDVFVPPEPDDVPMANAPSFVAVPFDNLIVRLALDDLGPNVQSPISRLALTQQACIRASGVVSTLRAIFELAIIANRLLT
jgi:hypothetical protein